ncbi:MAG TPA: MOFRL family protein, partial [Gemmataceae bacterium]|nr:MOFRL family protein [Gemmataceae bacterium]
LISLIISDVIGDPLDVIASGPTAPDPTTFADAIAVLTRYGLLDQVAPSARRHLEEGLAGRVPETPKQLGDQVHNLILGNNQRALAAAVAKADLLGYPVLNLGSWLEGETAQVATALAGVVRSIIHDGTPMQPPVCVLSGGETTVTLSPGHGKGGRNQEFALAMAVALGSEELGNLVILCGGTDGEDGPTDAAGAVVDGEILKQAAARGLDAAPFLSRHDAYAFFAPAAGLLRTGLTGTNVMDVRVFLLGPAAISTRPL